MTGAAAPLALVEIQARADAATPGPWHRPHDDPWGCVQQGDFGWVTPGPGPEYDRDTDQGKADAEFVAHARADVPALLAALADAQATIRAFVDDLDGGEWRTARGWMNGDKFQTYTSSAEGFMPSTGPTHRQRIWTGPVEPIEGASA